MHVDSSASLADLVARHPGAEQRLHELGIDTCCSGDLTLERAASLRGVPISDALAAFEMKVAVGLSDSVRDVISRWPDTAAVFERHGLLGCGGADGPDERIDLFASVHRIDAVALARELEAVARGDVPPPALAPGSQPAAVPASEPAALYRPFLVAALVSTLTLGATFGAWNVLALHLALAPTPAVHHRVHALAQVWGFVLLAVMGVSAHALPRFLGAPLRHALWVGRALPLAVSGIVGMAVAWAIPWARVAAVVQAAGAAALLLSVLAWAGALLATWRAATAPGETWSRLLAVGTAGWVASAGTLAGAAALGIARGDPETVGVWLEPVYALALYGGVLPWILGMSARTLPAFLELGSGRPLPFAAAALLVPVGAVLSAAGAAPVVGGPLLAGAGMVAIAVASVLACVGLRPWSGPGVLAGDRAFGAGVRSAYGFLLLAAALGAAWGAAELAGREPSRLVFDGARHAFTIGFTTLMVLAMGGRIVPVFTGRALVRPRAWAWGMALVALGALSRQGEVVAALVGSTTWLRLSAASGALAAAGIAIAGASLLGTLRRAHDAEHAIRADHGVPIGPDANVAALLDAHPEALGVLVAAGFAPLANPALRRTLARAVTIGQACRMHRVEVVPLLDRLVAACPAARQSPVPTRGAVLDALRDVLDPEIGMNLVELGLVYGVDVRNDGAVELRMTLTTPHCPHGQDLACQAEEVVGAVPGVRAVRVDLVFDPPWAPDRMSAEARQRLGLA